MPDVDEVNSNLGALEAQLEELSRLKGLVQSLSEREEAAGEAVQAAERATTSSKEVIERFEGAATRIEEAEVVERFEEIGETIQRFKEAGSELKDHVETLPEVVREPLVEYHEQVKEDLSGALSTLEEHLDRHHTETTDALASAREEQKEYRNQTDKTLDRIGTELEGIDELLQEAQLKSRLETLQDTASNANQAAQNGLSRVDAVERSLSDKLDEHRRRQERRADELEKEVGGLCDQLREHATFTRRLLWALLAVALLTLVLGGTVAYITILTP